MLQFQWFHFLRFHTFSLLAILCRFQQQISKTSCNSMITSSFPPDIPRIPSLSSSSRRTEIGFLAPHRAAYQGAPAWPWLHWYAKKLPRCLKASSSNFTAGNAGAPHLSAFGRKSAMRQKVERLDLAKIGLESMKTKELLEVEAKIGIDTKQAT